MADIAGARRGAPASRAAAVNLPGRTWLRAAAVFALAWAVLVVGVYYRQLWAVLAAGPSAWSLPELGQSLRWSGVPFIREAIARAASGIAAAAAVVLAVWTSGRLVARWVVPSDATRAERRIVEFATGVGVFAYGLFALALAGWFVPPVVAAATLLLALVGIALWVVDRSRIESRSRSRAARGPGDRQNGGLSETPSAWARNPWSWLVVAGCALAFLCALAPEVEYDALWYHLELPRRWLQAGRPVDDVNEYVSLYPLTWELVFGAALALDADVGAKLVHWITLPLSAAVAAWLARSIQARTDTSDRSPAMPALAAALVATAPTVFWEATSAYIDLALAFHAAVAVYALVRAYAGASRRWTTIAGIQLGLCCATKHLGLFVVASALTIWLASHVRSRRLAPGALASAVRMGVIALLIPVPWYVRAALASGNPVFPELFHVFGAYPPERWNSTVDHALALFKDRFGRPRTPWNLLTLPWDTTMHAARYGGTFGPAMLAFLPGTIVAITRSPVARALGAGAVLYLALWASPISSYQLRFLVPFWVVTAAVLASGIQITIDAAGRVGRSARALAVAAVVVLLALNLPPGIPLHEGDRVGWSGWLAHVIHDIPIPVVAGAISRDAYVDKQVRSAAAWRWIDANTPRGTRVLTFLGGDQFLADRARLWSETPVAREVTWDAPADTELLMRRIRALGIGYVLVQKPLLRTPDFEHLVLMRPDVLAAHFALAHEDFWMLVYRVRD